MTTEERINYIVDKIEKSFNEGRDPSEVNEELIDKLVDDGMTWIDAAYLCHCVAGRIALFVKEELEKKKDKETLGDLTFPDGIIM